MSRPQNFNNFNNFSHQETKSNSSTILTLRYFFQRTMSICRSGNVLINDEKSEKGYNGIR